MSEDYISYAEALLELQLSETELDEIVASGELRAFREGDEVSFKREDIATVVSSRENEPTIILSDTQADALSVLGDVEPIDLDSFSTDETVLNIEGLLDDETESTTPLPSASLLEDDLEIGGLEIGSIGDETVLDTDDLDLGDDNFDLDDDTLLMDEEDTLIGAGAPRRVQMVRQESHLAMTIVMALTMAVMVLPIGIILNDAKGNYPDWVEKFAFLQGMVDSLIQSL